MRGYEEKLITKICVLGNETLSILLMVAQYRQQNVNCYTRGVNCYVHCTSVYGNEPHVKVHMKSLSLAYVSLFSTNEPKFSCLSLLWTFEVAAVCEERLITLNPTARTSPGPGTFYLTVSGRRSKCVLQTSWTSVIYNIGRWSVCLSDHLTALAPRELSNSNPVIWWSGRGNPPERCLSLRFRAKCQSPDLTNS